MLTSVGALEEDYVRSPDVKSAHRCRNALLTGFQVLHHDKQTQIVYRCILGLDQESNCFNLTPCSVVVETEQKPKNLQLLSKMSMPVSEVVELRRGSHCLSFVLTASTPKHQLCLSIISTKTQFCLELASQQTADVLHQSLITFVSLGDGTD